MTSPSIGPDQCSSTALAMAAEAFPAPTTMVRPFGGTGRCRGTIFSGSAAPIAASNIALNRECGESTMAAPFRVSAIRADPVAVDLSDVMELAADTGRG